MRIEAALTAAKGVGEPRLFERIAVGTDTPRVVHENFTRQGRLYLIGLIKMLKIIISLIFCDVLAS